MNNLSLDMEVIVSPNVNLGVNTGTIMNTIDHRQMTYRDAAEQHPISAITNLQSSLNAKQDTLVSGTNIKTVNGQSIVGAGNITTPDTQYTGGTGIDISALNVVSVKTNELSYNDLQDKPTIPVVPTKVSAFENDAGYLTQHQDISGKVNRNELKQVAFSGAYNDLTGKPTIPTRVSQLSNDSGYITNNALAPYRTAASQDVIDAGKQATLVSGTNIKTINNQSIMGSGNMEIAQPTVYLESATVNETGNQLTIQPHNGAAITFAPESGRVDDVKVDGVSVVSNKIANITGKQDTIADLDDIRTGATAGTSAAATIATYGDIVTHDADEFASASSITDMATKTWVEAQPINNVTSQSTTRPLAANMGTELQNQINNLKQIGRFLAIWDAHTGAPTSEPTVSPYTYKVGDYYRIGAAGTRNPAPNLTYTIGQTNWVTGGSLAVGDVLYCSNVTASATTWVKQEGSGGGTVQDVQVDNVSVLQGGIAKINSIPATIVSGTLAAANIPNLDAAKITSGTLDGNRIPDLNANKITGGTLPDERIASAATWNAKQDTITASKGIVKNGNNLELTQAFYDYLDNATYQRPTISTFNIQNASGSNINGDYELGSVITLAKVQHAETNTSSIQGDLSLKQGSTVKQSIAPASSSTTITLDTPINVSSSTTFYLTGTDTRAGALSANKSMNFYRYAYTALSTATTAPTTGTKRTAVSTFQSNGVDITYSVGDYLYLYTTTSGKTVYTYVAGQWASVDSVESGPITFTQANGTTFNYYAYRVGPFIASGTAKYRV